MVCRFRHAPPAPAAKPAPSLREPLHKCGDGLRISEPYLAAPRAEYSRRWELSARRSAFNRRERLAGYSQLALAAFCLGWILFRLSHFSRTDLLLLIPVAIFVVLAVMHRPAYPCG